MGLPLRLRPRHDSSHFSWINDSPTMCAETPTPPATHISPMTIDQPQKHPQAQTFHEAAAKMHEYRYFRTEILEEQIEIHIAISEVAKELAYFYDSHPILEREALQAYRQASRLQMPGFVEMSADVLLTFPLEAAIQSLRTLRDL